MSFRFQSRVVLTGFATIKTGARLIFNGASKGPQADLSLVKDMTGIPYIPGSIFKRLLRTIGQDFLNSSGYPSTCDPADNDRVCIRMGIPDTTDRGIFLKTLLEDCIWSDEQLKESIEQHTCMLCAVFGSQLVEPRVVVDDLRPDSWHGQLARAKDNRQNIRKEHEILDLFTEDKRFAFRAVMEDCDLWQRGLVMSAVNRLQTKLLTVSSGGGRARAIATFELTDVRALESPREFLEAINCRQGQDGHQVESSSWEAWIASCNARLREKFASQGVAG